VDRFMLAEMAIVSPDVFLWSGETGERRSCLEKSECSKLPLRDPTLAKLDKLVHVPVTSVVPSGLNGDDVCD